MLAQTGPAFLEINQANLQEPNECGPCLLLTASSQVCGPFVRLPLEEKRRAALAVALYSTNVDAVLGVMDEEVFETHRLKLEAQLDHADTTYNDIICDHLPHKDAARFKRLGSNTVCVRELRELMKCGSMIKGDVINYYFEMLMQTRPEDTSLFIASSYFYQKLSGHSCCFHSTWHLPLVARRLPHAACRMPIM